LGQPEKKDTAPIDARFEVCQIIGRLMELWGFRKNLGRIWTVLFLADSEVSAGEIAERLSLSRGSTSMALQELQRWGVVRKIWKPGERKDFFVAEENIAKMLLRILHERELPAIDEAISNLDEIRRELEETGDDRQLASRTGDLLLLTQTGRALFLNLIGSEKLAASFLRTLSPDKEAKK